MPFRESSSNDIDHGDDYDDDSCWTSDSSDVDHGDNYDDDSCWTSVSSDVDHGDNYVDDSCWTSDSSESDSTWNYAQNRKSQFGARRFPRTYSQRRLDRPPVPIMPTFTKPLPRRNPSRVVNNVRRTPIRRPNPRPIRRPFPRRNPPSRVVNNVRRTPIRSPNPRPIRRPFPRRNSPSRVVNNVRRTPIRRPNPRPIRRPFSRQNPPSRVVNNVRRTPIRRPNPRSIGRPFPGRNPRSRDEDNFRRSPIRRPNPWSIGRPFPRQNPHSRAVDNLHRPLIRNPIPIPITPLRPIPRLPLNDRKDNHLISGVKPRPISLPQVNSFNEENSPTDNNSLNESLSESRSVTFEDETFKEKRFIEGLLKHTWIYGTNWGPIKQDYNSLKVTKIQKIKSPWLWQRYQNTVESMSVMKLPTLPYTIRTTTFKKNYQDIMDLDRAKEVILFHGTKVANIDSISQNGFSMEHAKNGGIYGKSLYFTDCCQKADQYTDKSGNSELAMFIVRVALGRVRLYSKNNENNESYDSVVGGKAVKNTMPFYEFMLTNEKQCYPEYVVYYERVKA